MPAIRANALQLVMLRAQVKGLALAEIDGLLPCLRDALRERDVRLLSVATSGLIQVEPDNELLVPALTRIAGAATHSTECTSALHNLGN